MKNWLKKYLFYLGLSSWALILGKLFGYIIDRESQQMTLTVWIGYIVIVLLGAALATFIIPSRQKKKEDENNLEKEN